MNPVTAVALLAGIAGNSTREEREARRLAAAKYRASLCCACGVVGNAPLKTWEGVPKCHKCLRKLKKASR